MKHTKTYPAILMLLIALMFQFTAALSHAQQPFKIAYADIDKINESYQKSKDYREVLQGMEKAIKDKEMQIQVKIQDMLKAKELLVKLEDKNAKDQEIERYRFTEIEKLRQEFNKTKETGEKFRIVIIKDIKQTIAEIGKEYNYDAIFSNELCLYAKNDITDLVIEKINQQYQKKAEEK